MLGQKVRSLFQLLSGLSAGRLAMLLPIHIDQESQAGVVVTRLDGIGDYIVWLDSARLLRGHYSDRFITLVASESFSDLASRSGYFDLVIPVNKAKFLSSARYRFSLLRRVSGLHADIAIEFNRSRNFWLGDSVVRATNAKKRIGHESDLNNLRAWQRKLSDRWYTDLRPVLPVEGEFELNAALLRRIGVKNAHASVTSIPVDESVRPSRLIPQDYLIIFPGAGSTKRRWAPELFGKVAQNINQRYGLDLVVCGGADEVGLAQLVVDSSGLTSAISLAGATSLPQFIELVRGAVLLISNETSAVHIAAAVGTESVCVLGGGHFGRFVPYPEAIDGMAPLPVFEQMSCYNCNWVCTQGYSPDGPVPCISRLTERSVIDAADKCLSRYVVH